MERSPISFLPWAPRAPLWAWSRYLKEQNKNIQIVGTQPTDGSSIPGIRRWTPEFLPKIFERDRVDRIIDVSEAEAKAMTRQIGERRRHSGRDEQWWCPHSRIKNCK